MISGDGHAVSWFEAGSIAACAYPQTECALADLSRHGVSTVINLYQRAYDPRMLEQHRLREVHLPVPDFTAPTQEQLRAGVDAIERTLAIGGRAAVHCGAGLGRTGTLLACYLVRLGHSPPVAMARVRGARPGSIETEEQEDAIFEFARLHR